MKLKHSPLRRKVTGWFTAILILMALTLGAAAFIGQATFSAFERVQQSHMVYYEMQEALETERHAFETCIREFSGENQAAYQQACAATQAAIDALPFDYEELGQERYARTWNIVHGYEGYTQFRDAVMEADPADPGFVDQLYQVLEMQEHLAQYALFLVQATLEQNNSAYHLHAALYNALPWVYVALLIMAAGGLIAIMRRFSGTIVQPLLVLAQTSREMADNDFSGHDLPVKSDDELGQLTLAFNRMKQSTEEHIATLEENNRIADQLHKEELAKVALQQNLENTRLEMLKSQVQPHFLFNTLNMISCMARLEDAQTTDKMILSLSAIFRHSLRTKAQEVWLEEELAVLEDYLYLQQMRFDGRITCRTLLEVDPAQVRIPSFTLQPVVENAFHHGLKSKEDGGRITLRFWQAGANLMVSIADNGAGMTPEALEALRNYTDDSERTGRGIGLGNIHRRVRMLYPDSGAFRVYSRPGRGTVIQLVIPQKERRTHVQDPDR